jgi:hypothetical protein
MIRNQRRHPNAKIHIKPIAQLPRNPLHNALALVDIFARLIHNFAHPVLLSEDFASRTRSKTAVEGPLHSQTANA